MPVSVYSPPVSCAGRPYHYQCPGCGRAMSPPPVGTPTEDLPTCGDCPPPRPPERDWTLDCKGSLGQPYFDELG